MKLEFKLKINQLTVNLFNFWVKFLLLGLKKNLCFIWFFLFSSCAETAIEIHWYFWYFLPEMLGRAIRMTWRMWNYRPIRARLPWYQGGAVLLLSAGCCMNHTTQHSKSARATKAKDLLVFCSARQQKAEAVCTIVSCIHLQSVGLEGDKSRQRLSKYYVVESAKNSNKLLVSICLYFCLMDRDYFVKGMNSWKRWYITKVRIKK